MLPGAVRTMQWVAHLWLRHLHHDGPDFDMEFVKRSLSDRDLCEEMAKDSATRKVEITV